MAPSGKGRLTAKAATNIWYQTLVDVEEWQYVGETSFSNFKFILSNIFKDAVSQFLAPETWKNLNSSKVSEFLCGSVKNLTVSTGPNPCGQQQASGIYRLQWWTCLKSWTCWTCVTCVWKVIKKVKFCLKVISFWGADAQLWPNKLGICISRLWQATTIGVEVDSNLPTFCSQSPHFSKWLIWWKTKPPSRYQLVDNGFPTIDYTFSIIIIPNKGYNML